MNAIDFFCTYLIIACAWFLTCVHRFNPGPGVVFTCMFWPLDAMRGLYRGAKEWWRA